MRSVSCDLPSCRKSLRPLRQAVRDYAALSFRLPKGRMTTGVKGSRIQRWLTMEWISFGKAVFDGAERSIGGKEED